MKTVKRVVSFLKENDLTLVTAESCTAGQILALLGKVEGCGKCLEAGFVVYSSKAKKSLLGVKQETIDKYTLTSEEIAREMASGALKNSSANAVIATTGIIGDEPMDGIPPGTVCFAWGFKKKGKLQLVSETKRFDGTRSEVQIKAAKYALFAFPTLYEEC
ncbi:putative 17.2kDa protein, CinA-related competence damage protein [Legionella beliardensis]|uniref:Putative 17.2kDa protein, CinA-related competence damage protein n=1 Tax=Legionella beliardensis TaxID=91822 RepID=A0A378HZD7_9GAMM|nr:CinA family protein [Legionella beliardensis]STX27810.1 putative 17.2kDa protein, CinA-related competence damage protein [Legionella beliardensis]